MLDAQLFNFSAWNIIDISAKRRRDNELDGNRCRDQRFKGAGS